MSDYIPTHGERVAVAMMYGTDGSVFLELDPRVAPWTSAELREAYDALSQAAEDHVCEEVDLTDIEQGLQEVPCSLRRALARVLALREAADA